MDDILGYWEILPVVGKMYFGMALFALLIIVIGLLSFAIQNFREQHRKPSRADLPAESMITPT